MQTKELTAMTWLLEGQFLAKNNILLVGESGSGKSWTLNFSLSKFLKNSSNSSFVLKSMFFYQKTHTAGFLKDIESQLEKKRKNLYVPHDGKKAII
jgi:ABC-type dipeptide/oligopeptide/nickel transport system ATPase component